ncbi:hypothetical protein [Burkholderia glumae]|uniref:hypothetical protein n=1 Tax=Burkholderia glumae TaxID=337 RepID=UPI001463105A|nr:hypothetical protein [Burkholderia glumae]QJP69998.1 hypothetical protein HJC54_06615 [Burkholderia glumae]
MERIDGEGREIDALLGQSGHALCECGAGRDGRIALAVACRRDSVNEIARETRGVLTQAARAAFVKPPVSTAFTNRRGFSRVGMRRRSGKATGAAGRQCRVGCATRGRIIAQTLVNGLHKSMPTLRLSCGENIE